MFPIYDGLGVVYIPAAIVRLQALRNAATKRENSEKDYQALAVVPTTRVVLRDSNETDNKSTG